MCVNSSSEEVLRSIDVYFADGLLVQFLSLPFSRVIMVYSRYLTGRALNGLKNYKYHATGYTILDTLHTPLWEWITARLPM